MVKQGRRSGLNQGREARLSMRALTREQGMAAATEVTIVSDANANQVL